MEEDDSFVLIRLQDSTRRVVSLLETDTIFDLKQRLSAQINQPVSNFILIFKGVILTDEVTPFFYGIGKCSVLYHANVAQPKKRVKPSELYDKFCRDLYKLIFSFNPRKKEDLLESILSMLDNPTLQAYSRINPESQFFMKEANFIIANIRESTSLMSTIAQLNDFTITKLEQTTEGIETIKELLESCKDDTNKRMDFLLSTNLDYSPSISEDPLPNPWKDQKPYHCSYYQYENSEQNSKRLFHGNLINTLKAKFAK